MNAAKSVTATFSRNTNIITATAGSGGTISPSGSVSVNYGANQVFAITPNNYYEISDVQVDGSSVGLSESYTFTDVANNHNISVYFTALDSDNDGVPDIEEMGPNSDDPNYDGNGDGLPDYLQNSVASLYTYDDHSYITLSSLSGALLTGVRATQLPQEQILGATFPFQFVEFRIEDLEQGASTDIIVKLPDGTKVDTYYKYGPTPENLTPHWYDFTFDGQTGAEISNNIVTLHFVDGLRGDDDITANGRIFDQGGPARTSASTPPVTGQTISYAAGDDGSIEAGVEWPDPRFRDNGDGTVTDTLTGLMWLKDGGCLRNNWNAAFQTVTSFNGSPGKYNCREYAAKYSDWRLPNAKELESLINYGKSSSAAWLNTVGFMNMKSTYYWSSTTFRDSASSFTTLRGKGSISNANAWLINMQSGMGTMTSKNNAYYLLPVRISGSEKSYDIPKTGQTVSYASGDDGYIAAGIDWPDPRFADNGDGTVTDNLTGLMWLKDGGCLKKAWTSALNAIKDLNANSGAYNCLGYTADHSDWRLPNVREIESLVNYGTSNSAAWLNSAGFMNVKSSYYWSSTTYQNYTSQAWGMLMTKGQTTTLSKSTRSLYSVWPVRGGTVK